MSNNKFTRRQMLRRSVGLGAGVMLASGLWPGLTSAADAPHAEDFTFLCVNDLHFFDHRCVPFFEQMIRQMKATEGKPEFCLIVGDLAHQGSAQQLGAVRDLLRALPFPHHVVIGNHDYVRDGDRRAFEQLYPHSINYQFEHRGWQFIALDTTQGRAAMGTHIQPATLDWIKSNTPKLNPRRPTALVTHFPMGFIVPGRPKNADDLLAPLAHFNLQAVFNGHFHGYTERHRWAATFTTDKCCSFHHANHDGTKEKGYFVCHAKGGKIDRVFVEVKLPA